MGDRLTAPAVSGKPTVRGGILGVGGCLLRLFRVAPAGPEAA
ncbi:MAG: hypothetical protein RLZZ34_1982 [Verrucomicrobiota bacterium]|jgi:hypothetical protein